MAVIKDPLKIAVGELGNTESPAGSNKTKYGKWYGMDGQPWCMMFVQYCFAMAGYPLPHKTASCSDLLNWYKKYAPERIVTTPQPRDIVIYSFGHTGILESAGAGTVTVIEGNTSSTDKGSQDNGGGVFRRTRTKTLVKAYIRVSPQSGDYSAKPAESGPTRPFDKYEEDIMTGKEIHDALQDYLRTQKVPAGSQAEFQEAVKLGITDGSNPCQLVPRWQAALMAKRAREGK